MLIQRHYLKEFWKLFALIAAGLSLVMSVFQLLSKIERFMPNNPSLWNLASYTILVLPRFLQYTMPMAALMAALFVAGQAGRNRELTALMVAGARMKRVFLPFVITGALLSIFGFVLGEVIVPASSGAERELKFRLENRKPMPALYVDGALWLRAENGSLVKFDFYMPETDRFYGVSIFTPEGDRLGSITRAEEARHMPEEKAWLLHGVIKHNIASGLTQQIPEMKINGLSGPEVVSDGIKEPYEISLFEIKRQLARLRQAGFKNLRLSIEMHSRVSFPLINMFLVVIGVSVASRRSLGGLKAAGFGITVSVVYWLGFTMMLTLGYAALVPPLVAVWSMPVLFGGVSAWLYSGMSE